MRNLSKGEREFFHLTRTYQFCMFGFAKFNLSTHQDVMYSALHISSTPEKGSGKVMNRT
jgi:hypothetical protein